MAEKIDSTKGSLSQSSATMSSPQEKPVKSEPEKKETEKNVSQKSEPVKKSWADISDEAEKKGGKGEQKKVGKQPKNKTKKAGKRSAGAPTKSKRRDGRKKTTKKEKGDRKEKEEKKQERSRPVCTFFWSEQGCRNGNRCRFSHERRSCRECGTLTARELCFPCHSKRMKPCQKCGVLAAKPYCFKCHCELRGETYPPKKSQGRREQKERKKPTNTCVECKINLCFGKMCRTCRELDTQYCLSRCSDCDTTVKGSFKYCQDCWRERRKS